MASSRKSSLHRGSDFFDFSCFTCQENDRITEAEFYCEDCSNFLCDKCVEYHNYLHKKHATLDKGNIGHWPVCNVDALQQCQDHKKELTGFCEDHRQLICHACHVYNHQKCSHVVLLADKVKDLHQNGDFNKLSMTVDTLHQQLIQKKDDFEESLKSLENSYKKILDMINDVRNAINNSLDNLERKTIMELDTLHAAIRTSIYAEIENCTDSINNIKSVQEDWLRRKVKSEAVRLIMYRQCLDQSLKTETVLQEMKTKNEMTLTFNADPTIQQTLATLTGLGQILSKVNTVTRQTHAEACATESNQLDPENQTTAVNKPSLESMPVTSSPTQPVWGNLTDDLNIQGQVSDPDLSSSLQENQPLAVNLPVPIVKVKSSQKYTVKGRNDVNKYQICGICETATGQLLITDSKNCNLKLLDHTYTVVAHFDLLDSPRSMCSLDSSLVAVTLFEITEVHFIRVSNGQLVKDRILKLKHACHGIAHHQGNLYITDGNKALYHYTGYGKQFKKIYEDTSGIWGADQLMEDTAEFGREITQDSKAALLAHLPRGLTWPQIHVTCCAASPDGERIYVANNKSNQLVTLSRDGTVIFTLTDPAWSKSLFCIHVTDLGQVLVCGGTYSNTITQVDRDGRQRLAEVVSEEDGMETPASVYYSQQTGTLIVGMLNNYEIMVFQTH